MVERTREVLRVLVNASGPLTAAEIADRLPAELQVMGNGKVTPGQRIVPSLVSLSGGALAERHAGQPVRWSVTERGRKVHLQAGPVGFAS
jgi:hypothetical protein